MNKNANNPACYKRRKQLLRINKLFVLALMLCIGVLSSRAVSQEQVSLHQVNPAGTFIRSGEGYIYAADVQPVAAIANILNNGTLGAIQGILQAAIVMKVAAMLPHSALATAVQYAWQYRMVAHYWDYYLDVLQGGWNYMSYRVGRMPVYLSSSSLDKQLIIHWLYPLNSSEPARLEMTLMPVTEPVATMKAVSSSPTEAALENVIAELRKYQALRLIVTVESNNLKLAVLMKDGKWSYQAVPRPSSTLLVEGVHQWTERPQISEASSLLTPGTLQYLADTLGCREKLSEGWKTKAVKVAESVKTSLFELGRTEAGLCDFLAISDMSSRVMGVAGYQHLHTGVYCPATALILSTYQRSSYESFLIDKAHNSMMPGWVSTLFFRIIEEGLAIGTRSVFDRSLSWLSGEKNQTDPQVLKNLGSQTSQAASSSESSDSSNGVDSNNSNNASENPSTLGSGVIKQVKSHAPRCLSVAAPGTEEIHSSGHICKWRLGRS